ncbi:uncharacterized protein LOC144178114 [Haemaphysalis longicornis]
MAQTGLRFPGPDDGLWTKDSSALPTVSEDSYHSWCRAKDPSERQRSRACRLATEPHCSPSSVRTNTCDSQLGLIQVVSSCFRSQRKIGRPYVVCLTSETDSGEIVEAACECPAGCSGACSHILVAVHLLVLRSLRAQLPQQWGRLRQQGIKPASVQDIDWRSPQENGPSLPLPMRLFGARRVQEQCEQQ